MIGSCSEKNKETIKINSFIPGEVVTVQCKKSLLVMLFSQISNPSNGIWFSY